MIGNAAHFAIACGYMTYTGHYFKHASSANAVTCFVEANNYFNMPSMLWCANTILVPFVKLSYHIDFGVALAQSTELINVFDYLGLLVTIVYTVAVLHAMR